MGPVSGERKILERELEAYFSATCKALGLLTWKIALRQGRGFPDRLVLHKGRALFIELKTLTGGLSPTQVKVHEMMLKAGHKVLVLRTKAEIKAVLEQQSNV